MKSISYRRKCEIFQDAYLESYKINNVEAYSITPKLKNCKDIKENNNIHFEIFIRILYEKGLLKECCQIHFAGTIFTYFYILSDSDDNSTKNNMKKAIKYAIKLYF